MKPHTHSRYRFEANTSYSWQVHARAVNSTGTSETRVSEPGHDHHRITGRADRDALLSELSKSVRSRDTADANLLLVRPRSPVQGEDHDLRHSPARSSPHPAGRRRSADATFLIGGYGRENIDGANGVRRQPLHWDGRDDGGRFVPQGVSSAVFEADGTRSLGQDCVQGATVCDPQPLELEQLSLSSARAASRLPR